MKDNDKKIAQQQPANNSKSSKAITKRTIQEVAKGRLEGPFESVL